MIKYICDKCGKEERNQNNIKNYIIKFYSEDEIKREIDPTNNIIIDLCTRCKDGIIHDIKEPYPRLAKDINP